MNERVAVIVPAHNAEETIGATLRAIELQEGVEPSEVVVVDDRSDDATSRVAAEAGARVLETPAQTGPAGARNLGAAATSAPIIAFTDADCEPATSWLSAALAELAAGADIVTGPITPVRPPGPFERTINVNGPSPQFETANLVVRRTYLDRVGGFRRPQALASAGPGRHFGEDVLFGWECIRAGAKAAYAEGALVHHAVFPRKAPDYVREAWRLRLFPPLVAEVPEIAARLPLGIFLSRKSALLDTAVAGVTVAAISRRPAALALAIPYAALRFRGGRPWSPPVVKRNAAYLAADLLGFAALAYGSLRSRRPLL
jgi:hypothetical protein